ncbi:hypothetical protein D3C81_1231580 [compost metagenome]
MRCLPDSVCRGKSHHGFGSEVSESVVGKGDFVPGMFGEVQVNMAAKRWVGVNGGG